ncbi:response regulator [bacterium]|nr:response regulator [bacterium]
MACFRRNPSGILYAIFASFLLMLNCTDSLPAENLSPTIELKTGWQYRIGDSPTNSSGHYVWLDDSLNSVDWTSVSSLKEIQTEEPMQSLWLRIPVPEWEGGNPGLFIRGARQIMQVWLGDELIYQYGDFSLIDEARFKGWRHHLIQLPDEWDNRLISFRIWSSGADAKIGTPVLFGDVQAMLRAQVMSNLDEIILGSLFIILALCGIFFITRSNRDPIFIPVSLLLMSMGVITLSNSPLLQTLVNAPMLFFYLDLFSMSIASVWGYLLLEKIIAERYRNVFRRFWQIHLAYAIFMVLFVLLASGSNFDILYILDFSLSTVTILWGLAVILKSRRRLSAEVKIVMSGMVALILVILIELAVFLTTASDSAESIPIQWFHFGALLFAVSLVRVAVYRYMESLRQKEAAQKEAMQTVIRNEQLKSEMALNRLESEKWQEMNRLKSRFLANISHELRTPLTLILGNAEQLINKNHNDEVNERSRLLKKHGMRLLTQVNQLLDLSKLDAGKMKLKAAEKDIIFLIKGIFHSFESFAEQHDIEMIFESDQDSVTLFYDHDKMETIVSNLISNAVKFTPAGGRVEVTVSQNEYLELRVSDTGPGILPEHLPQIFDRFYQADHDEGSEQKGSGIGLALCRELVWLHHGEIEAASIEGRGTVFTVKLPLGSEHLSEDELADSSIGGETTKIPSVPLDRGKRDLGDGSEPDEVIQLDSQENAPRQNAFLPRGGIKGGVGEESDKIDLPILLIVEDNSDMRVYIREVLTGSYRIQEAADGEAGFARAAELIPDLIISDVMMPKMDGYVLCEKLKTDQRTSHIPVVLLTAKSGKESKMEGLEQGADDYLVKPFESDELKIRVKNLIDQRIRLHERFTRELLLEQHGLEITSADQVFVSRAVALIESHIENSELSVTWFSREMGLSRSQLHRKMQAVVNQSPSQFISTIRLKRAALLLRQKAGTVSEIAYRVGFNNPPYFHRCFREQYGVTPAEYVRQG